MRALRPIKRTGPAECLFYSGLDPLSVLKRTRPADCLVASGLDPLSVRNLDLLAHMALICVYAREAQALGSVGPPAAAPAMASPHFRSSRERAEEEVCTQGPLREAVVQIEWACNVLESWSRWLFFQWVIVPKRVRKIWSHYGAIGMDERPTSGHDPMNVTYACALHILSRFSLSQNEFNEVFAQNNGTLGDLVESILGYAWWMRYRRGTDSLFMLENTLRAELSMLWRPTDFTDTWSSWLFRYDFEPAVPWLEKLVLNCEVLLRERPDDFGDEDRWRDSYEWLRRVGDVPRGPRLA